MQLRTANLAVGIVKVSFGPLSKAANSLYNTRRLALLIKYLDIKGVSLRMPLRNVAPFVGILCWLTLKGCQQVGILWTSRISVTLSKEP
jgi:hypothetical protein